MNDKPRLKLAALDADDLAIISAHLQDAIVRIGDIRWLRSKNKLAMLANRYDRYASSGKAGERRHCGFQISRVRRVQAKNILMDDEMALVSLLSITFTPGETLPEGTIELTFAGGGTIRADVECIEVSMSDLGQPWAARARPEHDIEREDDAAGENQ
jgi:hypothetical protein